VGALNVLTVNLAFSTLVFAIAARIYVMPLLRERSARTVLVPILLLHAFRNLGLMFLSPGAPTPASRWSSPVPPPTGI
jgi:hypothetical protein